MPQALEQALDLIRENRPEAIDRALALLQNTVYSFCMKVCGHWGYSFFLQKRTDLREK